MFIGTSILAGVAGAVPAEGETVLSQLGRAVFGGVGPAYYVLQFSTMGILILAANTAFADFPRLASLLARDGYMPSRFAFRGERLAFSTGIVALAVTSIAVVAAFGGRVEALIPLYAVGVFSSITLSQAGMVRHWLRDRSPGWTRSIAINGVGRRGDRDRGHHLRGGQVRPRGVADRDRHPAAGASVWSASIAATPRRRLATAVHHEAVIGPPRRRQRVIVPVADVTRDVVHALTFARTMSDDVTAVHVTDDAGRGLDLRARFERQLPGVPLVIVESPYRSLVAPLMRYLEEAVDDLGDEVVIVLLPEYVPANALERFLYNDNGRRIRERLLGKPNVLVAEVPYRRPA